MAAVIYPYTYGAGQQFNKQIEFVKRQTPQGPVWEVHDAGFDPLGRLNVPGRLAQINLQNITVERQSTTDKFSAMQSLRETGRHVAPLPPATLAQMPLQLQDQMIKELNRNHGRRIEITNDRNGAANQLNIFDPR